MLALILFFALSHIVSFLCSIFEAVLLSCTDSYVTLLKKRGSIVGNLLEEMKGQIDRPLAAILTLNTTAHTIGAAGVGASVIRVFGSEWFALSSIILTFTMLYFTEMVPKTIGALYWKRLVTVSAYAIKWMIFITYPFVVSFNFFARFLSRGKKFERITEEDIRYALETGTKAGVIEAAEQDMVENIFRLGDRKVGMLMRPRVDIEWIDPEEPLDTIRKKILSSKHHRFPLCKVDIDGVIGIVHSRDILAQAWMGEEINLATLSKPPLFVNEQQRVFELMDSFRKHRTTFALVTDEYGSIQGLITTADVMNSIADIEEEVKEGKIVAVNTYTWLLEGKLPIDEFKEFFHFDELPDEEKARYRTVSGLCMNQIAAIPKKGDTFVIQNYRFEVLKVRRRRVEKVLLTKRTR